MSDLATAPRARLFTAFGTVLYVDVASGELRHGPAESSPANAFFVADLDAAGPRQLGLLVHDTGVLHEPILCLADRCRLISGKERRHRAASGTALELIPLERGLMTFRAGSTFLRAHPDGRVSLSAPGCSTWELFLASETWCTEAPRTFVSGAAAETGFDWKRIKAYIVHPLIRMRANTKPRKSKVVIFGYTKWSHGRVYYDLCNHLYRQGYIVDILDWQVGHADYISKLSSYYDLFMCACDGIRMLTDTYKVPYDRTIAISHHEFDLRMLIEQKGTEIFNWFVNFGVVGESLYAASLAMGVPKVPMIASLGINYSEFHGDVSDKLQTVGYAGSMRVKTFGVEWKRGELAEAAAREAGLAFKVAGSTANQISFHDMPDFYRSVDAVLMSSISEGAGLPVMEAAAAGKLVIGTPVGHFPRKAYEGGGIIAPIEADRFKAFAATTLRYYRDNRAAYVDKCRSIQAAARQFDWQHSLADWVELIEVAIARLNSRPVV